MSLTVPAWINESFLATVLQESIGDDRAEIIIKSFTTKPATSGDNFLSTIVRVIVEYCCYIDREDDEDDDDNDDEGNKQVSLIIKIPHHGEWVKSLVGECYKAEHTVYTDLLSKMYDLLHTDKYFTPRLLYANSSYTMVFEDLSAEGYVMPDKVKQLDYEHSVMCVRTLARYHAGSVAVIKKYPSLLGKLGIETYYTEEKREVNNQNLVTMSECFVNAVENWNVFENFKERTKQIWEEITDRLIESYKPRNAALNVMNHGDLWTNNIMYRYDSTGRPIDVKIIDFQTCRYTSPIIDLCCFVFGSADGDVVETRLPELLDAYLDALNGQLEELGCDERMSKEELDRELNTSLHVVFALLYEFLPFLYPDEDTSLELPTGAEEKETVNLVDLDIYRRGYIGKNYVPVAIRGLRFLEKKGLF